MKELDEKKWEKFVVFGKKGFLRIATTDSSIDSIRLIDGNEKRVPYVTRSEAVNGIAQFVSENNYEFGSDEAGCITVGLDTQTVFYQPHKFVTGQNIQIVTGDSLNEDSAHFYVTILKKQMDAKFNWGGNGATLSRMKRLEAKLFCRLLDNAKFRRVFADKYPLILIDEYQDSYKPIIDRFISFFIAEKKGPQFGFFGDAWQTIYQSNNACGLIENDNLEIIKKGSNFRAAPRIVQLLNDLRPDLPQASAIDDFDGEVIVITCDDYTGPRRIERNLKGELPAEELKNRLSNVTEKIKRESSKDDTLKVLMITHKVLATQQGYEQLLEILADGLRDKEDPFLMFFMDTVEPIYKALKNSNMQLLFDTLGIKRFPIKKKSEKAKWKELQQQLENARTKRAIDVFELIKQSKLIPIPPKLDGWYHLYQEAPETVYASNASIQSFLELEYLQFAAVIDFLLPDAMFSTEHGVKGEEYDNVVFVIGKGWNLYQFETYAPMITGHSSIPKGKEASFERNRNLFYVCCSRAKKRLFLFVTVPTDYEFKAFLMSLIGKDNIYTYSQFLEMER